MQSHSSFNKTIAHKNSNYPSTQQELLSDLPSNQKLQEMLDGKDPQGIVRYAERIAERSVKSPNSLNTSQIRNIYGYVKKLELAQDKIDVVGKLVLIKPKLAYAIGRNPRVDGLKILQKVLGDAVDMIDSNTEIRFQNFCRFFEAILAYHKYYDEMEKQQKSERRR